MSAIIDSLIKKSGMFNCIKHVIDTFVWDHVNDVQRGQMVQHLERMQAYGGTYEAKAEIAQGADGQSMRITLTIQPRRLS